MVSAPLTVSVPPFVTFIESTRLLPDNTMVPVVLLKEDALNVAPAWNDDVPDDPQVTESALLLPVMVVLPSKDMLTVPLGLVVLKLTEPRLVVCAPPKVMEVPLSVAAPATLIFPTSVIVPAEDKLKDPAEIDCNTVELASVMETEPPVIAKLPKFIAPDAPPPRVTVLLPALMEASPSTVMAVPAPVRTAPPELIVTLDAPPVIITFAFNSTPPVPALISSDPPPVL